MLEDIIEQVTAIASLVSLNHLKYAFAVVLTKCDLLEPGPLTRQQIKQGLQPLTSRLDAVNVNYQTFYSLIPIVRKEGTSTLSPTGAAAPLLWLVWELSKAHNPGLMNNLVELVSLARPSGFEQQQEAADASLQSLLKPIDRGAKVKKILGLYLLPTTLRNLLLLALAIVASVGVVGLLSVDYKWGFQQQSKNLDDLSNIATLQQRGQFDQAVRLMEKLVQREPERLDLRLQLAELYEILGQVTKAETAYDQVLARQQNNIKALIGKAMLRKAQGDITTAKTLFLQAESAAPANLKPQVRALAQKAQQQTAIPTLSPK